MNDPRLASMQRDNGQIKAQAEAIIQNALASSDRLEKMKLLADIENLTQPLCQELTAQSMYTMLTHMKNQCIEQSDMLVLNFLLEFLDRISGENEMMISPSLEVLTDILGGQYLDTNGFKRMIKIVRHFFQKSIKFIARNPNYENANRMWDLSKQHRDKLLHWLIQPISPLIKVHILKYLETILVYMTPIPRERLSVIDRHGKHFARPSPNFNIESFINHPLLNPKKLGEDQWKKEPLELLKSLINNTELPFQLISVLMQSLLNIVKSGSTHWQFLIPTLQSFNDNLPKYKLTPTRRESLKLQCMKIINYMYRMPNLNLYQESLGKSMAPEEKKLADKLYIKHDQSTQEYQTIARKRPRSKIIDFETLELEPSTQKKRKMELAQAGSYGDNDQKQVLTNIRNFFYQSLQGTQGSYFPPSQDVTASTFMEIIIAACRDSNLPMDENEQLILFLTENFEDDEEDVGGGYVGLDGFMALDVDKKVAPVKPKRRSTGLHRYADDQLGNELVNDAEIDVETRRNWCWKNCLSALPNIRRNVNADLAHALVTNIASSKEDYKSQLQEYIKENLNFSIPLLSQWLYQEFYKSIHDQTLNTSIEKQKEKMELLKAGIDPQDSMQDEEDSESKEESKEESNEVKQEVKEENVDDVMEDDEQEETEMKQEDKMEDENDEEIKEEIPFVPTGHSSYENLLDFAIFYINQKKYFNLLPRLFKEIPFVMPLHVYQLQQQIVQDMIAVPYSLRALEEIAKKRVQGDRFLKMLLDYTTHPSEAIYSRAVKRVGFYLYRSFGVEVEEGEPKIITPFQQQIKEFAEKRFSLINEQTAPGKEELVKKLEEQNTMKDDNKSQEEQQENLEEKEEKENVETQEKETGEGEEVDGEEKEQKEEPTIQLWNSNDIDNCISLFIQLCYVDTDFLLESFQFYMACPHDSDHITKSHMRFRLGQVIHKTGFNELIINYLKEQKNPNEICELIVRSIPPRVTQPYTDEIKDLLLSLFKRSNRLVYIEPCVKLMEASELKEHLAGIFNMKDTPDNPMPHSIMKIFRMFIGDKEIDQTKFGNLLLIFIMYAIEITPEIDAMVNWFISLYNTLKSDKILGFMTSIKRILTSSKAAIYPLYIRFIFEFLKKSKENEDIRTKLMEYLHEACKELTSKKETEHTRQIYGILQSQFPTLHDVDILQNSKVLQSILYLPTSISKPMLKENDALKSHLESFTRKNKMEFASQYKELFK